MNNRFFPIIFFAFAMVGCSAAKGSIASDTASMPKNKSANGATIARGGYASEPQNSDNQMSRLIANDSPNIPRNVVKTGSMTIQVDNVDAAEKAARGVAESLGGRVDRISSADLASPQATMDMMLRIPVSKFETAMEKLQSLGTRVAKSVEVQDVTDQIIDFNARLRTMRVQEEQVRKMLARAGNLSDSLTINNDLTRLRGEIEALDAKRQILASQASFSTLDLRLTQNTTAVAVASTDPNWFQSSWAEAWGAGTVVFRSIVSVFMWLVVFSPLWILGAVVLRRAIRTVNAQSGPVSPA